VVGLEIEGGGERDVVELEGEDPGEWVWDWVGERDGEGEREREGGVVRDGGGRRSGSRGVVEEAPLLGGVGMIGDEGEVVDVDLGCRARCFSAATGSGDKRACVRLRKSV
jgi:hypothetical protein